MTAPVRRSAVLIVASALCCVLFPVATAGATVRDLDSPKKKGLPVLGVLAIEPVTGDIKGYPVLASAGGCPKGIATLTTLHGPGLPEEGENVIGNTETWEFGSPPNHRMVAPMTITIEEAAQRQQLYRNLPVPTLRGEYSIVMTCRDRLPTAQNKRFEWGVYVGRLRIEDGRYTALTTAEDLPKDPSPLAGSDAMANVAPESALQAKQDEEDLPDFIEALNASTVGEPAGDSNTTAALATSASVLMIGLGVLFFLSRRGSRGRN